jgi:hypothetical protein
VILSVVEGPPGWSFVVGDLVPGLSEALSIELGVTVATWFADDHAHLARLEIRRRGSIVGYYPARLGLHSSRVDPAELTGNSAGMREAASSAGIPLGWELPPGSRRLEVRLRL